MYCATAFTICGIIIIFAGIMGTIYRNNELKHWKQKNRIMSNFISIIGWGLMESVLDCLYTYSSPFSMKFQKLYLEVAIIEAYILYHKLKNHLVYLTFDFYCWASLILCEAQLL